jgi:adhesin transport system outer membrane protein
LEASQAYINLLTAIQSLGFAKQSADNIRKQTGMEQSRVERGSGFSSDVLQVKAQLAGAQANLVRSQGAVRNAMDRYRNVFREQNIDVKKLKKPKVPYGFLPKDLKSAIETAKRKSLSLKLAKISVQTAKQDIRTKRAAFAPKLEAKGDYKWKHNDGGVMGKKWVTIGKVEMTWPLLTGGKDVAGYRKSFNSLSAAEKRYTDARHAAVEQVRNSWQNLETSRLNAGFLRNQANISGEFLDLARKERKLGTRTLLDVLAGETSFITSISAAVAAEAARDLAVYNLLFAMGELSLDNVELEQKTSAKEKPSAKPPAKSGARRGLAPQ